MRNLDESISGNNLDESFSNYSGTDVVSLRAGISELKSKLAQYEIDLDATYQTANPAIIGTRSSLKSKINSTKALISEYESQLSKIPKSIVNLVDGIESTRGVSVGQMKNNSIATSFLKDTFKLNYPKDTVVSNNDKGIMGNPISVRDNPTYTENKKSIKDFFTVKNAAVVVVIIGLTLGILKYKKII